LNAENQLEQRVPAPFHSDHESLACPLHGKVHDRFIRSGDEFITETALQERKARIFPKGSVLVAMIGQGKTRGSTALMEIDTCVNQNFACITPREVESRYLFFALDSAMNGFVVRRMVAIKSLNCALASKFPIPFAARNRQCAIVDCLSECEAAQAAIERHVSAGRKLLAELTDAVF